MLTREEVKEIMLKRAEEHIKNDGEDYIVWTDHSMNYCVSEGNIWSPMRKCLWTAKEVKEAIEKDACLVDSNINLVDIAWKIYNYTSPYENCPEP